MRLHTVRAGDTLQSIAQLYLYQANRAIDIQHINNLATQVIAEGSVLKIPDLFSEEKTDPNFAGAGIVIDSTDLVSIPSISLSRAIDSFSAVASFNLPNEDIFRKLLKPFNYSSIDIYFGSELLFTGKALAVGLKNPDLINVSCKGKCGILETTNIPTSAYPRTRYNTSLKTIAKEFCNIYSILLDIDENAKSLANKKFIKMEIGVTQSISDFLIELARQRNLILSETNEGLLRISLDTTTDKAPVLNLVDPNGDISFDADKIFSDYTALRSANDSGSYKTANTKLDIDIFRQKSVEQTKRDNGSAGDFLKAEIMDSLLSAFKFNITLPYLKTVSGDFLKIGEIITVQCDRLFIPVETDFIISDIDYDMNDSGNESTLKLFPLEWYKGNFVKFWEQ